MREKTVLIIDDERRMADSLRDLLAGAGFKAQVAYGGPEGIEALKRATFQVVVTDLRMQGVDGLAVIRFINDHAPRTLILVVTGYSTTESAIEAIHYHVFEYLRKPFDFDLFRMAIEKAFQKIETEQLREDTAAMITHDIKIPLTSIIGFAAMLYDREQQKFHPRAREFAESIQANGQKILVLIDNYLTTCKVEAGTLKIMPVALDLRQAIVELVETAQVEASRRGRRLVLELGDLPESVEVDEPLLFRAYGNMLQNAIKYSSTEGTIHVRAGRVAPQASPLKTASLCFEVTNPADALQAHELDDIFQRYTRAALRPGTEGSGLGLYVVQAIAHAHGGEVSAEFLSDGKIRFAFYLPLAVTARGRD